MSSLTVERSFRLSPEVDAVLQSAAIAKRTKVSQIVRDCIHFAIDNGLLNAEDTPSAAPVPSE